MCIVAKSFKDCRNLPTMQQRNGILEVPGNTLRLEFEEYSSSAVHTITNQSLKNVYYTDVLTHFFKKRYESNILDSILFSLQLSLILNTVKQFFTDLGMAMLILLAF